ncbi:hypothetical protein BJ165DRAFT_1406894 [Panaeolus papilionaceus]|nr:hypothetical protein BJ165DRAFT_1406894 [Panaeolus papilionaceus]
MSTTTEEYDWIQVNGPIGIIPITPEKVRKKDLGIHIVSDQRPGANHSFNQALTSPVQALEYSSSPYVLPPSISSPYLSVMGMLKDQRRPALILMWHLSRVKWSVLSLQLILIGPVSGCTNPVEEHSPFPCGQATIKLNASCNNLDAVIHFDKEVAVLENTTTANFPANIGHGSGLLFLFLYDTTNTALPLSELFTPRLLLLINEADILLSTGQFGEAAKVHSEAIAQSCADSLLYDNGGNVYSCMQRHTSVLEDFKRILSLTSSTFNNWHLMEARIQTLESTHTSLALYVRKKTKYREAEALGGYLTELERVRGETEEEPDAGLWNAQTPRVASHDVEVGKWRAGCALGAGDVEGAVGDLTRLSHLLAHIFHLAHPYLPPSPTPMTTLKQSPHSDPDSKPCLGLHRLCKALNKSFFALDELLHPYMRLLAVTPFRSSLLSAPLSPSPVHCFKQTLTIAVRALFSSIRSDSPTPPPSLISDDDADKATITNNAGNVIHYKRATAYFPYSGSPAHSRILNKSSNSPPAPFTTSASSKCKSTLVLASAPTLLSPAKLRTSTRKWKSEQCEANAEGPSSDVESDMKWRAEGSAIGDLARRSRLLALSMHLLTHIFCLVYFYLPPSLTPMATLNNTYTSILTISLVSACTISSRLSTNRSCPGKKPDLCNQWALGGSLYTHHFCLHPLLLYPFRLSYLPTSPIGDNDADKSTITDDAGGMVPVTVFVCRICCDCDWACHSPSHVGARYLLNQSVRYESENVSGEGGDNEDGDVFVFVFVFVTAFVFGRVAIDTSPYTRKYSYLKMNGPISIVPMTPEEADERELDICMRLLP